MSVRELFDIIPSEAQSVTIRLYPPTNTQCQLKSANLPINRFHGEVHVAKKSNMNYLDHIVTEIWISNIGHLHINCI